MGSSEESPFGDQHALPLHSKPNPTSAIEYDGSNVMADEDTMKEVGVQVPSHPIPSMQGAFAESIFETSTNPTPKERRARTDSAAVRRQNLLDQETAEVTSRWRQKSGQRYHELWKLMAQISFGMYLLLNGIARDEEQVMSILQGHVDEVDEFLEMTLDDFNVAQEDIDDRLKLMKLPLKNIHTFDAMLEERQFRLEIVSGNEQIEHVITRTTSAVKAALKDVQQGLDACKEFTCYLAEEQEDPVWRDERPDMEKVYDAMKGNVEGWYKAYVLLQTKGNHLSVALVQLGSIIAEMDRRAGEISRKTRFSMSPNTSLASPPQSPPARQSRKSREARKSMSKILPEDPNMITPIQATLPAISIVQDREPSPEPESRTSSPEPETFILSPRTYTPVPASPRLEAPTKQEPPAPEVGKRSSLRTRFSLGKRKDTTPQTLKPPANADSHWGPRERVYSVSETQLRRQQSSTVIEQSHPPSIAVPSPHTHTTVNTPPSRGLDSAYCSDFEKPLTPLLPLNARPMLPKSKTEPPSLMRDFNFPIPSPRSDQTPQYFRPVNASPNSPLQRPWTAGPGHTHTSSTTSSLERSKLQFEYNSHHQHHHRPTPSQLGLREQAMRSGSRMGMSVMSDMTTLTMADGRKVKKKRSAFGWLKKAFSLDEEEKAAFEERKRRVANDGYGYGNQEAPRQKWVDGKRVK